MEMEMDEVGAAHAAPLLLNEPPSWQPDERFHIQIVLFLLGSGETKRTIVSTAGTPTNTIQGTKEIVSRKVR
jgi:hypothetical protein